MASWTMHGQSDIVLHSSYVVLSGIDSVVIQGSGPIGRQHEEGNKKTSICDAALEMNATALSFLFRRLRELVTPLRWIPHKR